MYLNDYPKCITKNESNIPVPKSSGRKKTAARSQFPELQKYIETIIKASNRCDSEDVSDSVEKSSKVGKSWNNTTQFESKKINKRKFNLNLNSEKLNERTKTTVSVSSREKISNKFFSVFEDPRNWDVVTAQDDSHKNIKIEKALKNLFPNPYKLLQIPEFKKPKISLYVEKIGNDDVTLHDVIIHELDSQKTVDSTRVETLFEADRDKISRQTELWSLNSRNKSRCYDNGKNSDKTDGTTSNAPTIYSKNLGNDTKSASRQNSLENVKDNDSMKRRAAKWRKSAGEHLDYDIGKLKLLTLTDSDDSSKDGRETGKKLMENFKCVRKESMMVKECLTELSEKHKVNQTEARNRSKSDGRERKTIIKSKSKRKKSLSNSYDAEDCSKDVFGNYEQPKTDNVEQKEKEWSGLNEKDLRDDAMEKTGEKIDEVLQFMCDCLMKFRYEGDSVNESSVDTVEMEKKRPKLDDRLPSGSSSKSQIDMLPAKEVSQVVFHIPSRRLKTASSERRFHLSRFDNPDVPDTVYPDSAAINESLVPTVEIQNELGGYTEEQRETQVTAKDTRFAKSILPMPARIRLRRFDTQKVLKKALEREEMLLNGRFNAHPSRSDFFEKPVDALNKESQSCRSVTGAFKRQHSNFVICVNSLPLNMKSKKLTSFSLSPWTISLDEIPRPLIKPLPYYQSFSSEELKFSEGQFVRQQARKTEALLVMHRSTASHNSTPIGIPLIRQSSKVYDESLSKNSENRMTYKYKPIKKSFYVKPSVPSKTIDCIIESCHKIEYELPSILNDQVKALEDAIEETEKVYFLEQNSNTTHTASDSSTGSRNEICKNLEWDEEIEKSKLHDLLMRTYNLQQKLQRHLKTITDKPISISCPSIQQETGLDFGVAGRNSEAVFRRADKNSEDAIIYWYLQTSLKPDVLDEAIMAKVDKTDRATFYDPPSEDEYKNVEADSNDDDRSSTYSFKSSNDFSENEKEVRVPQQGESTSKNIRFLENIFNEIDIFKNRLILERNKESELMKTYRGVEEPCKVIKTPTKLLKTVFRGKESLTELSLGLKAVPLAKVSNISIEKRKISENHTKISICISKEKANEFPEDSSNSQEMMRSRLSYYLDSIRPSLSSCRTDYSKLENEIRRGESEDEDDFKSVLSTLSRPHSEKNLANEMKGEKKMETNRQKTFTKHRFDFYHKMDTSHKVKQKSLSNTSCTYKEFEPLKQALTEMQIRMRSIKRDAYFSSNDYYQRALKLAKMSAGFCQSCGSRSVIPQDTFGYYKTILPRNQSHHHRGYYLKAPHQHSSYYSIRPSLAELSGDLNFQKSSSYLLNSSRAIIQNSLNDISTYSGMI